jgi:heme exporter protein A
MQDINSAPIPSSLADRPASRLNMKFVAGGLLIMLFVGYLAVQMVQATMSTGAYYLTVAEVHSRGAEAYGQRIRVSGDNVHKRFGRKRVLGGVDLAVEQGQVMALLGANGAGKSTLMRIICRAGKPDRGDVMLGGVSLRKAGHEMRRYIGLVSHAPLLYDNLSAWDNLHLLCPTLRHPAAGSAHRSGAARGGLVAAAPRRRAHLQPRHDAAPRHCPRHLHDPPVLLLDEPDTGLDPASAETLARLIRELGASNRAILADHAQPGAGAALGRFCAPAR